MEIKRTLLSEDIVKIEHYQNESTDRKGYLVGLAIDCFENPNKDRNSHYFARELMYKGFTHSAIKEFERYLTIGWWAAERSQSLIFIGDCLMQLGKEKEALDYYQRAYLECSDRREPLLRLGKYFFDKQDWPKARFYLEGSLPIKYSGFYADDMSHYGDYPYGMLYAVCYRLGDYEKSKEYFNEALRLSPDNETYKKEQKFYEDYPEDLPTISILIPTLGRPEGLKRCLDSIDMIKYPKDKLEVLSEEDSPRMGVAKRLNSLFLKSKNKWIVYGSNDIEFTPDCLLEAVKETGQNNLIAFNTGELLPDKGNICEHFMINRDYVVLELDGKIFDEDFNHIGVDNLLWARCQFKTRAENAIIHHYHFSRGGKIDPIYELGWSEVENDRKILTKKMEELNHGKKSSSLRPSEIKEKGTE